MLSNALEENRKLKELTHVYENKVSELQKKFD